MKQQAGVCRTLASYASPSGHAANLSRKKAMIAEPPPEAFYRKLIADEAASGEPELMLLSELLSGGTAVDVGANQGVYAFALSQIASEVHAFEAHPDFAKFARSMLGAR